MTATALLQSISVFYCMLAIRFVLYASLCHTNDSKVAAMTVSSAKPEEHRKLAWRFVPSDIYVDNNNSYDDYDDKAPSSGSNDAVDRLRTTDVCYKGGTYSLTNCPSIPNCNFSGKFGPAKLCINRAPLQWDHNFFYIMVMKCIPEWENCDKCLCGYISSDKSGQSHCIFSGETPDDDKMNVNCNSLQKVTFQTYTWTAPTPGATKPTANPVYLYFGDKASTSSYTLSSTAMVDDQVTNSSVSIASLVEASTNSSTSLSIPDDSTAAHPDRKRAHQDPETAQ